MKAIQWIAAVTLTISVTACTQKEKVSEIPDQKEDAFVHKTAEVKLLNYEQELTFTGEVSYDQSRVDQIYSPVSGIIEDVKAELGARVSKGQVLGTIQSTDVSDLLRDYNQARSAFDIAKRNADNVEQLYQTRFASETDLSNAKKQVEIAQAEVSRTGQIMKLYGGAAGGKMPVFPVKAPISGYVVERNVNTGMQIRSDNNVNLFTISDLKKVWILINVYESDVEQVKTGEPVTITTLAYPDKEFSGKITNIASVVDSDTKVLRARVELDNAEGLLKPDMFATIKLHIAKPEKLLAIPPKAVIFDSDHYYVIVDHGKEKYELRSIEILRNTSKFVYAKSGVKSGDQVVTEGSLLLFNELND